MDLISSLSYTWEKVARIFSPLTLSLTAQAEVQGHARLPQRLGSGIIIKKTTKCSRGILNELDYSRAVEGEAE